MFFCFFTLFVDWPWVLWKTQVMLCYCHHIVKSSSVKPEQSSQNCTRLELVALCCMIKDVRRHNLIRQIRFWDCSEYKKFISIYSTLSLLVRLYFNSVLKCWLVHRSLWMCNKNTFPSCSLYFTSFCDVILLIICIILLPLSCPVLVPPACYCEIRHSHLDLS